MENKRFFFSFIIITLFSTLCLSAEIRIQRPQRPAKAFLDFYFQITPPENFKYTFLDTEEQNVKVHRWTDSTGSNSVEIRCGKDLVHLEWKFLRAFYFRNTKDYYKSVTLEAEQRRNVGDKWIWIADFNAVSVSGNNVKGKLFITKHRDMVYFITALTKSGDTFSPDIENAINSIKYL